MASGNELVQSSAVFQLESCECEGGTDVEEGGRGIGRIAGNFGATGRDGVVRVRLVDSVVDADFGMVGAVSKPPFKMVTLCLLRRSKILPQSSSSALTSIKSSVPQRFPSNVADPAAASSANWSARVVFAVIVPPSCMPLPFTPLLLGIASEDWV